MDTGLLIGLWLICEMIMGGFGVWIANQKGRKELEGFILGFFFGPLGIIVEAVLPLGVTVKTPDTTPEPSTFVPAPPSDDEPVDVLAAMQRAGQVPKKPPYP